MDAWLKVEQPSGTLTLLVTSYNLLSAVPSCSSEGLGFPGLQVQATPGPLSQIHSQNPSHVPVGDANIRVLFFSPPLLIGKDVGPTSPAFSLLGSHSIGA